MAMPDVGNCPDCGGNDGHLNIGRKLWGVCHGCKTKWFVGEGLFKSWRHEDDADWSANANRLAGYREVVL